VPLEISTRDLSSRLAKKEPILLLDVRELWEHEIGHLPGDKHIPMNAIPARLGEIVPPPGGLVVCYCHLGVRSLAVAGFLEQSGISAVSLAGGIDAWSVEVDPSVPRY
jgi:rhodanese-related sulfurtransferase